MLSLTFRRFSAVAATLVAVCGFALAGTGQAQAATTGTAVALTSPTNFALVCDLNAHAASRVDISGFDVSLLSSKVDASNIWYRSLEGDRQTQAGFTPDRVQIWLMGVYSNGPLAGDDVASVWTVRGGALGDGVSVPSNYSWDPSAKLDARIVWTDIRMSVRSLGGDQCYSPTVPIS